MSAPSPERLLERAETADFSAWYRERRRRERAREGRFEYIGPREPPPAAVHFPSSLLLCHRKRRYVETNAPAEQPAPLGRYRTGTAVEEDLVHPFLEDQVTGPDTFVTNGIGFEVDVDSSVGPLRLRGRTDPVVTTLDGTPLVPTEVKTVADLDHLDGPRESHRAQLHAYLHALSEQSPEPIQAGLLAYVSRQTLAVETFQVSFEERFWRDRVVPWMATLTKARSAAGLPPADPEQDWECSLCSYRRRCGRTEDPVADAGPAGFVPGHRYPRPSVEDHLEAHEVPLTPTLARAYPTLADSHPVADWHCPVCDTTFPFDAVDRQAGSGDRPHCPDCATAGEYAVLEVPGPDPW